MKIVGMRIEKYIDKAVDGHNCDFKYYDAEFERHILFGVLSDNRKVKITLSRSEGECYSGWTTASWGHIKVEEVNNFEGYTFVPVKEIIIDDLEPNKEYMDINNEVFSVSYDGGDEYYPSGYYHINMELFRATKRHKRRRPVWIFMGESNSGKSFIASKTGLNVYETDKSETLPDVITQDIIVLGNKHKFTVEDIKKRLFGEYELCVVNFGLDK